MKKENIDIIGIILSFVIGLLIGYFLKANLTNEDIKNVSVSSNDSGFIYLVEVGRYDNSSGALNAINRLKQYDIYGIYIEKSDIYYVYCGLFKSSIDASEFENKVFNLGINCEVKKEYLLDYLNNVDEVMYEYYAYYLECYLDLLEEKQCDINKEYLMNLDKKTLLQNLLIIESMNNNVYAMDSILEVYKILYQ